MIHTIHINKNEYIPTGQFPLTTFKYPNFNPVQSAYFKIYHKKGNKVLASATSSGKTINAEMSIAHSIEILKKKAMYIGPLKALTQEKIDDWSNGGHPFSKYKFVIATGDYMMPEKREEVLKQCETANIIIMTPEILDSITRKNKAPDWFSNVGVIVVDESHLLTMPGRGSALECALMRFTQQSSADIVFLSATMSNVQDIAQWISLLNSKNTYIIETDWRPCALDVWYEPFNDFGSYSDKTNSLIEKVMDIINSHSEDKFLVFVHSKNIGRKLLATLKQEGIISEFHNADLSKEDRIKYTELFKQKNGRLRVLVATSTLAWGTNLPARRVVIAGTQRGLEDVSVIDIKQMVGRSGRVGIDPKGDAYILYPESTAQKSMGMLENPEYMMIKSRLSNQDELAFHIVSEINKGSNAYESLWQWLKRSFAVHQLDLSQSTLRYVLDDFLSWGIAKELDGIYQLTPVGKIAAWFYYSPYMVAKLNLNFYNIPQNPDAVDFAWAIGTALPECPVSADIRFESKIIFSGREVPYNKEGNCYAVYLLLTGQHDNKPELAVMVRGIQADSQRLGAVIKSLTGFYKYPHDVGNLAIRLQYGVPDELIPLCKIQGIGAIRAKKLYDAGIKGIEDIINNPNHASKTIGNAPLIRRIASEAAAAL